MNFTAHISGTGSALPKKCLSNADLEKLVETSDVWIRERTGIANRHIASEGETTSDLALEAARSALEAAGLEASDIDGIIFATVTPDSMMPSAACILQTKLGCRPGLAFDLSAACSGFVYALSVADNFVTTGMLKNVLVIGAETLSRIVDYRDRETCILFGDGAGAAILSRTEASLENASSKGFRSFRLFANGTFGTALSLASPFASTPFEGGEPVAALQPYVQMRGREIFRAAVTEMSQRCREALDEAKLTIDQIDWFIPHQANIRIIEVVGEQVGIKKERTIVNVGAVGNTSSASIPIAFDQAIRDGRIQRGDKILLAAFGAGLTSASALFEY